MYPVILLFLFIISYHLLLSYESCYPAVFVCPIILFYYVPFP